MFDRGLAVHGLDGHGVAVRCLYGLGLAGHGVAARCLVGLGLTGRGLNRRLLQKFRFSFSVLSNNRWTPEFGCTSCHFEYLTLWITSIPKGEKISHQEQPYLQVYICIPHSETCQPILRNSPWWGRGWGRWVVGTIATPIQILIIFIIFMAWSELNMSFFKKFLQFCILLSLWPQSNLGVKFLSFQKFVILNSPKVEEIDHQRPPYLQVFII